MAAASFRRMSLLVLAFCCGLAVLRCTNLQSAASGGTGSETVIGTLANEDGSPAAGTEVTLHAADFDPLSGRSSSDFGIDTTDSLGRYSISVASPVSPRFTLQAVNLQTRTKAIIQGTHDAASSGPLVIASVRLRKTGRIKAIHSDSSISGYGYIFIPGTTCYAPIKNGSALIDSVPAQIIPHLLYDEEDRSDVARNLADDIDVKPELTTIVAFSGAAHSKKLVINTSRTGAYVNGDVFDFPLVIRLSGDNFNFSEARTNGSDIRFVKADNTALPFEVERWDAAGRKAEIWVTVDTIHGNDSSSFIVMYWGEPATAIALREVKAFDTTYGFRGVWHLAEEAAGTGAKGLYKDATGVNHGDDFVSATDRTGIIGFGRSFDGVDDFIPVHRPVTDFIRGDLTISLWITIGDSGGTVLSKLDTSAKWNSGETSLYFGDGTDSRLSPGTNGTWPSLVEFANSYAIAAQPVVPGDWRHLAVTWKWHGDSTGTTRFFIDGMEVPLSRDSLYVRVGDNALATIRIGQPNNNESFAWFKGLMDELRISAVARSADWIKLCYMNQRKENMLVK